MRDYTAYVDDNGWWPVLAFMKQVGDGVQFYFVYTLAVRGAI